MVSGGQAVAPLVLRSRHAAPWRSPRRRRQRFALTPSDREEGLSSLAWGFSGRQVRFGGGIGRLAVGPASFRMAEVSRRERLGATGHGLLEGTADVLDLPRVEVGGEHLPGAVHQVVRFVHEEGVIARLFGEVAAQIDLGVEHVVVIAHDDIHPGRQVERKLERADLVLAADGFEHRAGDFLARQGVAHGRFAAVVVAASKRAGERVAGAARRRLRRRSAPVPGRSIVASNQRPSELAAPADRRTPAQIFSLAVSVSVRKRRPAWRRSAQAFSATARPTVRAVR